MIHDHPCYKGRLVGRRFVSILVAAVALGSVLAACADESSEREFAGGTTTTVSRSTESPVLFDVSSPEAAASPLAIDALIQLRPAQEQVLVRDGNTLFAVDSSSGESHKLWSGDLGQLWAAELSPRESTVALLTTTSKSHYDWTVVFIDLGSGEATKWPLRESQGTPGPVPDVVVTSSGDVSWKPDGSSVAVSLPTGGIQLIAIDGDKSVLSPASTEKRPGVIAWSDDGGALAFVNQPKMRSGSGIWAGSTTARPLDPITIYAADPTGNRFVRGIEWYVGDSKIAAIIERDELGRPHGDLLSFDYGTGETTLLWTSPPGSVLESVDSFAVSPDNAVLAFVTNQGGETGAGASKLRLKQIDGPGIAEFELPGNLTSSTVTWTPSGVVVAGSIEPNFAAAYLLTPGGDLVEIFSTEIAAPSPVASPHSSPAASPVAATPVPNVTP